MINQFFLSGTIILLLSIGATAQSGGQFTIEKSVIAGGGQNSNGGQFSVENTNGQTVAGQNTTNATISLHAGFWNPDQFVPTAAEVIVSGRVTTANGSGIRNVRVTITNTNGESQTARTGSFGYFRFTEIPAGATYIFTAVAKRYTFSESSQVRTIVEDTDNINFVALGE